MLKLKIYKRVILMIAWYRYEMWSLTVWEEYKLQKCPEKYLDLRRVT
jgi:hypothetical protein